MFGSFEESPAQRVVSGGSGGGRVLVLRAARRAAATTGTAVTESNLTELSSADTGLSGCFSNQFLHDAS